MSTWVCIQSVLPYDPDTISVACTQDMPQQAERPATWHATPRARSWAPLRSSCSGMDPDLLTSFSYSQES